MHADLPTSIFSFITNIHLTTARNKQDNGFSRKQVFYAQKIFNLKGNLILTKALIQFTIFLHHADDGKKAIKLRQQTALFFSDLKNGQITYHYFMIILIN